MSGRAIFFSKQERNVLIKALECLKEEYVFEDVAELGFTPVLGVDAHSTGPFQPELETAIDNLTRDLHGMGEMMTEYDGWYQPIKPKREMMKDIIVEFSGWVRLSPENAKFVKIGEQDERPDMITGVNWQKLDKESQGDYILESVTDPLRGSDLVLLKDGDYTSIDVFEDDSP